MRGLIQLRIAVSGIIWAAAYNAIWGVAWFTFMRHEWQSAFATLGRPHPWSSEVWLIWGLVTLPLGAAVMAYADSAQRRRALAVQAAFLLAFLFSLGMTVWGVQDSLPLRVLALDALVNVVSMPIASLVAVAALQSRPRAVAMDADQSAI